VNETQKPIQGELPFAIVDGKAVTEVPQDLYIPPDAMEVFLDRFEGPLDLLLYLIRKQNMDILDIQVAEITKQYIGYIELMSLAKLDLAAEYLVMAAILAEIKSRMMLPRPANDEEDEEDPRAQLIRRLQEYERYRSAAEDLDTLPRVGRDIFPAEVDADIERQEQPEPDVSLFELLDAFRNVLTRMDQTRRHQVAEAGLTMRERMTQVLERISIDHFTALESLFDAQEGREGVVVTFIALLELLKERTIILVQNEPYAPIHVKAAA